MNSGIYQIVNLLNGKMYVGSTKDFEKRKKVHFVLLIKNKHFNIEPLVKMADILEVDICDFFILISLKNERNYCSFLVKYY